MGRLWDCLFIWCSLYWRAAVFCPAAGVLLGFLNWWVGAAVAIPVYLFYEFLPLSLWVGLFLYIMLFQKKKNILPLLSG